MVDIDWLDRNSARIVSDCQKVERLADVARQGLSGMSLALRRMGETMHGAIEGIEARRGLYRRVAEAIESGDLSYMEDVRRELAMAMQARDNLNLNQQTYLLPKDCPRHQAPVHQHEGCEKWKICDGGCSQGSLACAAAPT